jgi:nicotinamidase-related amidase
MALLRVPYKMLLAPAPPFALRADNTALLLLDVQHFTTRRDQGLGVLAAERGIEREFDEYYRQVDAALENLTRLVAACRAHGVGVLHSVLCGVEPDGSDRSRQMRSSELPLPIGEPKREIRPEVAPAAAEPVLARTTYSPFVDGALAETLRGADTLLIAGMLANMTVWQAAREAADRDFGVVVVMDCCASESLAWHGVLRTGIVGGLIRQRTSREVIEMLEGLRT